MWQPEIRDSRATTRPRLSSDSDARYARQPSPAESYMSRRHAESMYEGVSYERTALAPTTKKSKALALLQAFRDEEEERLAELNETNSTHSVPTTIPELDYLEKPHLRGSYWQDAQSGQSLFPEIDELKARGRGPLYGAHGRLRPYKGHSRASSENLIELGADPPKTYMPELPGSQIQGQYPAEQWKASALYGDKRFNTLPGEAFPRLSRQQTPTPSVTPGVVVSPPSAPVTKEVRIEVQEQDGARWALIRPDLDPRTGLPLALG